MTELVTSVLVAVSVMAAVCLLVCLVKVWPRRGFWLRRVLLVASAAWFAALGASIIGAVVPDALDELGGGRSTLASSAVAGSSGCGHPWPLVRIEAIDVSRSGTAVEWRCSWSIVGWPAFSGSAECRAGTWITGGYRDMVDYGSC